MKPLAFAAIVITALATSPASAALAQGYTMTPDGGYVGGDDYTMTPDGGYVGEYD